MELCNMLFEELVAEDPERKPNTLCPYCQKALAFHQRKPIGQNESIDAYIHIYNMMF